MADSTEPRIIEAEPARFASSKLENPAQRFLAHVIEHCFEVGRRSAADFMRHFSARAVMTALDRRPDLRADVLVPTTGVNHKVALRKSADSSGEDLQIALDEGVTSAADIVSLFRPDDRVRYLDNRKLWTFVTEGEFWKTDKSKGAAFDKAKAHIAFMLDRGLIDGLLSHGDLVEGVSVETLAQSLPREKLGEIINAALSLGRDKKGFTERDLLATAAAAVLVEDVSLVHIWESVIEPRIAIAHGFVEGKTGDITAVEGVVEPKLTPPAANQAEPMPGMTQVKTDDLKQSMATKKKKKLADKPAKKMAGKGDGKGDGPPSGLEELLVDVDDFEIEEIDDEYSDQQTAT